MLPAAYNMNVQIFQTDDHVVILNEMVHNARIVPLDEHAHDRAHLQARDLDLKRVLHTVFSRLLVVEGDEDGAPEAGDRK